MFIDTHSPHVERRTITFPCLKLNPSSIPGAGLGLFAVTQIHKGWWVTEYGGKLISSAEAKQLGEDGTHVSSLASHHSAVDSRITEDFPIEYYVRNHLVGGFINDFRGAGLRPNTCKKLVQLRTPYIDPHGQIVTERLFVRATRDIEPGQEILCSYGPTYWGRFRVPNLPGILDP